MNKDNYRLTYHQILEMTRNRPYVNEISQKQHEKRPVDVKKALIIPPDTAAEEKTNTGYYHTMDEDSAIDPLYSPIKALEKVYSRHLNT